MGIPSYFRRILQKFPGCLTSSLASNTISHTSADALCFDFNCLIYRCLRSQKLRPFPAEGDPEDQEAWEGELLGEVEACVKEIWRTAGKPARVYLAVDGVVPMAKIRQQRVRRFKSAWLRGEQSSSWDSNSITPGTHFMDKLVHRLEDLCSRQNGKWTVSGVREEGEGEHKIMRWMRNAEEKCKRVIVYGLDADLILLTLLAGAASGRETWLLREKQEFGMDPAAAAAEQGPQEYQFMNLQEFAKRIQVETYKEILNYIALMTLMGNDFIPHSITHKIGDDGHEYVMDEFKRMKRGESAWLVEQDEDGVGKLNSAVLQGIFVRWAQEEEEKMAQKIVKKREQAGRGVLKGMDAREGLPLEWNVERIMIASHVGRSMKLVENWREEYWKWLGGKECVAHLCSEYVKGCVWVLDYYQGLAVDKSWMFPAWIPPLWSDLAAVGVMGTAMDVPMLQVNEANPITPEEQLAMVLPLDSWGLIQTRQHRQLPRLLPQYWPKTFSFFSFGRKWLWECEALLPPLTVGRLRDVLREV